MRAWTLVLGDLSATGSRSNWSGEKSRWTAQDPYAVISGIMTVNNRPLPFAKTFRDSHWVPTRQLCFVG